MTDNNTKKEASSSKPTSKPSTGFNPELLAPLLPAVGKLLESGNKLVEAYITQYSFGSPESIRAEACRLIKEGMEPAQAAERLLEVCGLCEPKQKVKAA